MPAQAPYGQEGAIGVVGSLPTISGGLGLKRTAAVGFGIVTVWMSLGGGFMLLRSGDVFGWVALVFGVLLLIAPLSGAFRRYWNSEAPSRAFPILVLTANLSLLLLYGAIARSYLSDPFLTYNDLDTLAAVVFGTAAVLTFLALAANAVALVLDRRS